ncbi:aminodeoxychorismate synthase component I [bacterium]|jgi:aminodeoxychorismate synthase component I|nr:aminodeoxychorismate synthase component I [bacterium]
MIAWLDSSDRHSKWSTNHVIGEGYMGVFRGSGSQFEYRPYNGVVEHFESDNPYGLIDDLLARFREKHPGCIAIGFVGYDDGDGVLPEQWFAFYQTKSFYPPLFLPKIPRHGDGNYSVGNFIESELNYDDYKKAFDTIQTHIREGDTYQINFTQRFQTPFSGDPFALYTRLRQVTPAPFSAYINGGDFQILSSSPELFFRKRGSKIQTRPIKGTIRRGATPKEDDALKTQLLNSEKDQAELVMITDLERNDLGQICQYGSVSVPELATCETYAQVHHLAATVDGTLKADITPMECLKSLFPGGSITGAPKQRAIDIIESLETVPRAIYTGCIGWVDAKGNADFNIAIRTMYISNDRLYWHAGGGLTAGSNVDQEWEECQLKASGMIKALGEKDITTI